MRMRTFLAGLLTLVASTTIVGFRSVGAAGAAVVNANPATSVSSAAQDGVWICHFAGHEGPNSGDFVTFFAPPNTIACDAEGGNPIHVGRSACWNGHKAAARFGKDCDTTDQP